MEAKMQIELRELSTQDGKDILEMLREIGPGENGFMNPEYDMDEEVFKEYLFQSVNNSRGIGLEPSWVPQTKFWLVIDGRPVGYGKLRHYLNDNLRNNGGHIGYCIRPSERGKGYGNIILSQLLEKARQIGIPRALITCRDLNKASAKVIEYNGGRLECIRNAERFYWIVLDKESGMRELHIDDYREIYCLWKDTPGMGLSNADSESNFQKFMLRNKALSFCWKEENRIIGTILCGHDGRRGYIYHVTVAPCCRGKGTGSSLVQKSLENLKEQGIDKCHLFVFADNEPGRSFWETTGWTRRDDILVYSKNI
jgi:predicted acetyltransferase